MSPTKKLSEQEEKKIIKDLKSGTSQRKVASKYDVSKSTIQRLVSASDGVVDRKSTSESNFISF